MFQVYDILIVFHPLQMQKLKPQSKINIVK